LQEEILENILKVYLRDTEKSYILQANGEYIPRLSLVDENTPLFNSQNWLLTERSSTGNNYPIMTDK
jgi:hypothetical protein